MSWFLCLKLPMLALPSDVGAVTLAIALLRPTTQASSVSGRVAVVFDVATLIHLMKWYSVY